MANIFTNLAVPASDGVGAGSDTSAMGKIRTITVQNTFTGAVNIEFSNEAVGGPYAQVATFSAPGKKTIELAGRFMRVRRSGVAGGATPDVDVASDDAGGLYLDLPAPAGDGTGASVDVSAFGTFNTVAVLGTFQGTVIIEISEDNTTWAQCMAFQAPGWQSKKFVAQFMRVRRAGTAVLGTPPGLPNVDVGAINDGGGGSAASAATNCLIYRPGSGLSGPVVFDTWADLITRLTLLRANANGSGCYEILFDALTVTPAVIPAGAYDMTNVTWTGESLRGPGPMEVSVADGATFTGLKQFKGNLRVSSVSATTPPVALADGDLISIFDGATVRSTAGAPFFGGGSLSGSGVVVFRIDNVGTFGNGSVAAVTATVAGSTLVFSLGSQAEVLASSISTSVGTTLVASYRDLSGIILTPQAAVLGSVVPIYLTPPRMRVRGPFVALTTAGLGDLVQCDPSGGGFIVNLPAISIFNQGQEIKIKNITGSVNPITVTPAGANTIDGAATRPIVTGFEAITLTSDGVSNWVLT